MTKLIVRSSDFRLVYKLVNLLKEKGIAFEQLELSDPLPESDSIWFATEEEVLQRLDEGRGIACEVENLESIVQKALHLAGGLDAIELAIGIDPGPRPGIAWLADGVLIGVAQLEKVEDVADHIRGLCHVIEHSRLVVRIGDGSPLIRDRILNDCLGEQFLVEFVDEAKTSRGLLRHNHAQSAVRIALLRGKRQWEMRDLNPSEGELREIQRQSRIRSGGMKTISGELAYEVACGNLSLEEALLR